MVTEVSIRKRTNMDGFFSQVLRDKLLPVASELSLVGGVDPPNPLGLPTVTFQADGVGYKIWVDASEHAVGTQVTLSGVEPSARAELADIVVAARLGSAQSVYSNSRLLEKSIGSHAGWIRRVHPLLTGDQALELVRAAASRRLRRSDRGDG